MKDNIQISVIMSAYNCEDYIEDSVKSILDQTFNGYELIVIDDHSRDGTLSKLKAFKDERLVIVENGENLGLTRSLIKAIELSRGKYIARIDADDISYTERLEKQFAFLEDNPDIGLCATWMKEVDPDGAVTIKKTPLSHDRIVMSFLRTNSIGHSSVMLRKEVLP